MLENYKIFFSKSCIDCFRLFHLEERVWITMMFQHFTTSGITCRPAILLRNPGLLKHTITWIRQAIVFVHPPYPPITGKLQVRDFPKMQPAVVHTAVTWHKYQSRCCHLVQVCLLAEHCYCKRHRQSALWHRGKSRSFCFYYFLYQSLSWY